MIGIITANQDTFTNPTLFAIIKKLNDSGHDIALFNTVNQHFIPPELNRLTCFDGPRGFQIPKRPDNLLKYLSLYGNIIKQIRANQIVNIIAVDPVGLIIAGRVKKICKGIRIHYFSFEIFFNEEVKQDATYSKLKKKEIFYSKQVSSILIQDEERKKMLVQENRIPANFNNWYLIPVAPQIGKKGQAYHRSHYGLKESDVVYVHSGSIAAWAGINQIIEAVESGLPENTYIFIHNRAKFDPSNPIHSKLLSLKAANAALILHDEIFEDYDDYLSFLQIFDYGIVLYEPDGGIFTGNNIQEIGLSSGKFATYMAVGLPSLMHNCTTYQKITASYPIGLTLSNQKLGYYIQNNSLKSFKKTDCITFYKKVLDPEVNINSFLKNELLKN